MESGAVRLSNKPSIPRDHSGQRDESEVARPSPTSGIYQASQQVKLGGASGLSQNVQVGTSTREESHHDTDQTIIPPSVQTTTPHKIPAPPSDIKAGPARKVALISGNSAAPLSVSAGTLSPTIKSPSGAKMIFSKSTFTKLRNSLPHAVPVAPDPGFDADLLSRDKTKQKEAVRRFLAEKVRNDWDFLWPAPGSQPQTAEGPRFAADAITMTRGGKSDEETTLPDTSLEIRTAPAVDVEGAQRDPGEVAGSESDAESVYSTVSEDGAHWRPRAEWTSDLSDDDEPIPGASPFRFDSPDAVGKVVQLSIISKKTRRRRVVTKEMKWNDGLACFEARRNAWTGSKTVRVKPKAPTPSSPSTGRLTFWRHHRTESSSSNTQGGSTLSASPASPTLLSPLSPMTTRTSHNTDTATMTPPPSEPESLKCSTNGTASTRESNEVHALYPIETLVPIAPPFLPPQNPMRASVTPAIYPSLYDKIVASSLQPSCPVNLKDVIRSCVVGWKRDGEWPPRPMNAPMPTAAELAALRHRKALAAEHARKQGTATNSSSRRKSFGFLPARDDKEKERDKGPKEQNHDEEGGGKGIRRGLQKVFSLGHGHSHSASGSALSPTPTGNANTPPKEGSAGCIGIP